MYIHEKNMSMRILIEFNREKRFEGVKKSFRNSQMNIKLEK